MNINYFAIPGFVRTFNAYTDEEKFDLILINVSKVFDVTQEDILGKVRRRLYMEPRHCLMFMACALTKLALAEIGVRINGRDHATVIHGRDRFRDLCLTNIVIRNCLKSVCNLIHIPISKVFNEQPITNIKTKKFRILNALAAYGPKRSVEIIELLEISEQTNPFPLIYDLKKDDYIKLIDPKSSHRPPRYDLTIKGRMYLERCT